MKPVFTGCATALITPFTPMGAVDYPAFDRLIAFQLQNKVDALVIAGTTGEASTLSDEEQIALIAHAVQQVGGRVPVIAGTGSNDTQHAIHLSRQAYQAGADALLLVTPYYNKTTQRGLEVHFTAIAQATPLAVILYTVPGRTGMNIAPETVRNLAQAENIVAIKDATGDLGYTVKVRELCGDTLAVYSGNDDVAVPVLSVGGQGVISVLANIMPAQTHQMAVDYLQGNTAAASRMQVQLKSLIDALFMETNPIPVKYAASRLGLCQSALRLPLVEAAAQTRDKIDALLQTWQLV